MRSYAQGQTATPEVDSSYMGTVVIGNNHSNYYFSGGDGIIGAVYLLPFFVVLAILLVLLVVIVCIIEKFAKEARKLINSSLQVQANIISGCLVCFIFYIFTLVLDMVAFVREDQAQSYDTLSEVVIATIFTFAFNAAVFSFDVIYIILWLVIYCWQEIKKVNVVPKSRRKGKRNSLGTQKYFQRKRNYIVVL